MTDRLFDIDEIPEVPLFREPRRSRGEHDARFRNEYPPEWHRCPECEGTGFVYGGLVTDQMIPGHGESFQVVWVDDDDGGLELTSDRVDVRNPVGHVKGFRRRDRLCADCLGMGSVKRKVRLLAGFRCERCLHPYLGKGDMKQLGRVELASNHRWARCDERCRHGGPMRVWTTEGWTDFDATPEATGAAVFALAPSPVEAEWRILTVHHLDGDKANLAWWNLACLCQRCHLEVQAKVVMERIYPHEHSEWFRVHAAGYYASVYLGEDLLREEALGRLDELLALERAA